jgi:hypothetical protein
MIKKLIVLLLLGFALSAVDVEARKKGKKPKKVKAPEFDVRAVGAPLALLGGGAWVLSQRRRRETGRD